MNTESWWLGLIKLVGVPTAVAAYFMVRDFMYMSHSIELQTQTVELLRQLVQVAHFGK